MQHMSHALVLPMPYHVAASAPGDSRFSRSAHATLAATAVHQGAVAAANLHQVTVAEADRYQTAVTATDLQQVLFAAKHELRRMCMSTASQPITTNPSRLSVAKLRDQ